MHHAGVLVAVLGLDGFGNGGVHIGNSDNRDERHHLLLVHKDVVGLGLAEEELRGSGNVEADGFRENGGVAAHEVAVDDWVRATSAFAFWKNERFIGEGLDLLGVELDGSGFAEGIQEFVSDGGDDENLLLADAEKVVVVGSALDDRAGGGIEVGGFVNDHGRISRAGADSTLAGLHRGGDDGWTAGDAKQFHMRVLAERIEGLERRLDDGGEKVGDAGFFRDRLIVFTDGDGGALRGGRVRVVGHGIAGGDHVDRVAGEGRNTVGRGRDRADDSPRSIVDDGEAGVAAEGHAVDHFDAGNELAADGEFFDLVIEAADFGLVEFDLAPLLGFLHAELANDGDRFFASCHTTRAEFLERALGGLDGGVHVLVNAIGGLRGRGFRSGGGGLS